MKDAAHGTDGATAEKYSDEQVEHSRRLLGRDPEGADLRAHHDEPDGGTVTGDEEEGQG